MRTASPNVSQLNQFSYDAKSLRYRHVGSGKFISAKTVRAAVDTVIGAESLRIQAISKQLVNGEINLAEWQIQTSTLLKHLHVATGLAAAGGVNGTSASDLGYIGSLIKKQYQYLRDFAKQIKNGTQKLDGTLVSRSALYAQAARGTYENVLQRAAKDAGLLEEKSVLGAADHCSGCLDAASLGWSPIGSLVPIGQRQCLANCHCYFIYRGEIKAATDTKKAEGASPPPDTEKIAAQQQTEDLARQKEEEQAQQEAEELAKQKADAQKALEEKHAKELAEQKAKHEAEQKALEKKQAEEKRLAEEQAAKAKQEAEALQKAQELTSKPVASVADLAAKYPHTNFEFDGVDPKLRMRIVQEVDRLFTNFPSVAGEMEYFGGSADTNVDSGVTFDQVDAMAMATRWQQTGDRPDQGRATSKIFLNPQFFDDHALLARVLKKSAEGWLAGGSSAEAIIAHEFGHSVDFFLAKAKNQSIFGYVGPNGEGSIAAIIKEFKQANRTAGNAISGYAKYGGPKEQFPEALSSLRYGSNPTQYAKKLSQLLDQVLPNGYNGNWQTVKRAPLTPAQQKEWNQFVKSLKVK